MEIRYDAFIFEKLAKIISAEGWVSFLKQGPSLEPLYPFVISVSIKIASWLGISYQKVQSGMQVLILLLSQLLLYKMLCALRIRRTITALIVAYFGLSPAIINSTFSLFSEIITYPFIIGLIFLSVKIWQSILKMDFKRTICLGIAFSLLACTATFAKAILEYVFMLYLFPFLWLMIRSWRQNQLAQCRCCFAFIVLFMLIFQSLLHGYKRLNDQYNGHYTLTDSRGPYYFYQYAVQRAAPFDKDRFLIALFSVPGENVCRAVYGERCRSWWWDNTSLGIKKAEELKSQGVADKYINDKIMKLGIKEAASNPFQFTLFMSLEMVKLLFWESTKVGYVAYPRWVQWVYDIKNLSQFLRLFVFLLTTFSLFYTLKNIFYHRHRLYTDNSPDDARFQLLFFLFYFTAVYILMYSLVLTITRYAFPVVSLYLAVMAFTLDKLLPPRHAIT